MEPLDIVSRYPEVFAALPVRRYDGEEGWDLPCPVSTNHKRHDKRWSARVWEGEGRLRFWCGRGCRWADAVAATGTKKRAWFRRALGETPVNVERKITARYRYEDQDGQLLYEVCRTDPKGFFQRRPAPGGKGWVYDLRECHVKFDPNGGRWRSVKAGTPGAVHLPEVRYVLYRFADIRNAPGQPVLVVEGEKSAEALRDLGFTATCSPLGAGKWRVGFGGFLADRHVIILPDNDEPGLTHGAMVAGSAMLMGALSVRMIRSGATGYDIPVGGDVYDWLAAKTFPGAGGPALRDYRRNALMEMLRANRDRIFTWKPPQVIKEKVPCPPAAPVRKAARKGMKQVGTMHGTPMVDTFTPEAE